MKSLRNKVVLSAVVLAFALIATIGSTYAWFTVSDQASVTGVELNVQSSKSLLMRVYDGETGLLADDATEKLLDASTYSSNVSFSDITGTSTYSALDTYHITPVTAAYDSNADDTYDALNAKDLNLLNIDTKVLSAASGNATDGNYIDIKFWLLSQTSTETVALDTLDITASNVLGTKDAVTNAVNVAVWESGHSTVAAGAITGFVDTESTSTAFIFSLNPDYAFAFESGMRGYNTGTPVLNSLSTAGDLVALHSLYASTSSLANVSADTLMGATSVVTLTAGQPTLVTVRIYVEGWDAQTTNAILAAAFQVSFKFTLRA
ncbi:MAG: hypothetical protein PHC62_11285 [Candidatus Izemoplasmatales bacterium]|nr:hypothetical protein [Candidatus Izemoplasmatales bacterium]